MRLRTKTEQQANACLQNLTPMETLPTGNKHSNSTAQSLKSKSLADFQLSDFENAALSELQEINNYVFHKLSWHNRKEEETLLGIQDYLSIVHHSHTQKSNVKYLKVMNAVKTQKIQINDDYVT